MSVVKFTNPYSSFDPRYIPGCIFWIDAADASSITISAGLVTQVRDRSESANNAVTLTSAPTYGTFANGRPAISFNGSQGLQVSDRTKLPNGANSAHSFFAIVQSSVNSVQGIMTWGNYSLSDTMQYYVTTGGGAGSPGVAVGQFGRSTTTTFDSTTISGPTILSGTASSTAVLGWRNGNAFSNVGTSGLVANISTSVSNIGCLNGTGIGPLNGRIGEIIIFNRVISTAERQQVEGYLAWKWAVQANLPVAHPYTSSGKHGPYLSEFRPTDLSNCNLWIDTADRNSGSVELSGTTVTNLFDKTNNCVTTVGGSPQYSFNAINSKPGILLTSTNFFTFFAGTPISGNSITIFGIATLSGSTTSGRIVSCADSGDSGDTNQVGNIAIINPSGSALGLRRVGSTDSGNLGTSTPFMFSTVSNATNNTLFVNGTSQGTPSTNVGTFTFSTIGLGYNATTANSNTWNGFFGEIIIYYAELPSQQRQQVEGYLAWKWALTGSLPSTHPFKNFPPLFVNP